MHAKKQLVNTENWSLNWSVTIIILLDFWITLIIKCKSQLNMTTILQNI